MKDTIVSCGELKQPKGIEYHYIGEDEKWHIREDAPDWAVKEFNKFFGLLASQPDDNGMVAKY